MNFTLSDWITKFRQSNSLLSNNFTQDILVIIGFLTVCLFLFLLILQFALKVRQIYRTSEPKRRYKKSRYPSYQKLLDINNNQCKCFHYSCLPKFQCIKSTCQISNYEQINEKYSIYRISSPRNRTCIDIHN
jgi:hypothetical protein